MTWRISVLVAILIACAAPATTWAESGHFVVSPSRSLAPAITMAATLEPDVTEGGFRMKGSHGYWIAVAVFSVDGRRGRIYITARRRDANVSYVAPAKVTADAIHADLGRIGRVDVTRHALGGEKTVHPKCLGGAQTYEPATYEGVIEFNGEEGFTRVRASRVAVLPAWIVFTAGACGGGYAEAIGSDEPGARLRGVSFAHGRNLSFQVNKNSPTARVVFKASLKERRNGVRIEREVEGVAPGGAFRFGRRLRTASLSPSAPFSGSASLGRSLNSFWPIWTGDLALDFPGRAAVPMAGHDVHVSLVHARFKRSSGSTAGIGF
jgi:hypothetical protein